MRIRFRSSFAALVFCQALALPALAGSECEQTFDSTYDLIQQAIFENKGCTSLACHGDTMAGDLDLRAGASYDALVSQPATSVPEGTIRGLQRVVPGQKDQSLLFLNLAAATLPDQWQAPLRPMPIGLEPLSVDELEAVREWIEQGAPREGTVPGTGELLDACLPPAKPIAIEPLPVPDPEKGRQIRMPQWELPAESEDEVCFASYFDISDGIPERFLSADGDRFRYDRSQIRQDPLSHHLIVTYYTGDTPIDSSEWGPFACRGGDNEGQPCSPTDLEFCGEGLCGSEPKTALACIGFGPPDSSTAAIPFPGTQEASFEQSFPEGVFGELPTKGLLIWNSHAFNLTDEAGVLRAWINFDFAEPENQLLRVRPIFNSAEIFKMSVPVFEQQEVCHHQVFPANTRLFELNSHNHQRGKRFRVFEGRWACRGGADEGEPCSPDDGTDPDVPPICGEGTCARMEAPPIGDCDGNGTVGIADLTRCVNISLGSPLRTCWTADPDGNGQVSVSDLVKAVNAALDGPVYSEAPPELLYTNLVYNDPTVVRFDPPREYPGQTSNLIDRTLTYCNLYDNGFTDPAEVKNRTTSPQTPIGIPGVAGGPCRIPTGCTEGLVGERCSGNSEAARNASCDTSPGAGDGFCDACTLGGGVTTEDEMFILMGGFYVDNR